MSAPQRIDPDVDLRVPAGRRELGAHPAAVLGAIVAGGVLGALAPGGRPGGAAAPAHRLPVVGLRCRDWSGRSLLGWMQFPTTAAGYAAVQVCG